MTANLREQLTLLPGLLVAHVNLCAAALGIGLLLSLPLGLVAARSKRWGWVLVSFSGVVQTIPGLALLALMVPLLGAFGFVPALVALILYSMLPVLRNTVVGITGIDPAVLEAAHAVGMTPRQVFTRVELPLALPVIVAGIRTATVWVVGTATLSTPVGQASLGNFIFTGLQTRNWTAVGVGCVGAALLALSLDGLLATLQRGVLRRRPMLVRAALATLFVGLSVSATSNSWSARSIVDTGARDDASEVPSYTADAAGPSTPIVAGDSNLKRPLRIGAKTFTEQYILAHLIESRARAAGLDTQRLESLGSSVVFDALVVGKIDVYVDYTGTIFTNAMHRSDLHAPWQVSAATADWLAKEHGIRQLGELGFENAYALAMRADDAGRYRIRSLPDLAPYAPKFTLGGDYEFFARPEWKQVRDAYGLHFSKLTSFDSTFMYPAVRDREVEVISAFSSDGRIAAFDLTVLHDPKHAFPPYDAVILLGPTVSDEPRVVAALQPLIGAIPVELMRAANWRVDRDEDKQSIEQAARWLSAQLDSRHIPMGP